MKNLIRYILKEQSEKKFNQYINDSLNSGKINPPYFKNLESYGLADNEILEHLSNFFNGKVNLTKQEIRNKMNRVMYWEAPDGWWEKINYDENGNKIYSEVIGGHWKKWQYDEMGNLIYTEDSNGEWRII